MLLIKFMSKKENLKVWLKECLKKIQGDDYNRFTYQNIILEIFQDDKLNCVRLQNEIKYFQENNK